MILLAVWTVIAGWWLALRGGAAAIGETISPNPFDALLALVQGHTPWPGLISDLIIVGELVMLAGWAGPSTGCATAMARVLRDNP